MTTTQTGAGLGFDPDALRAKHRGARDKRLWADGSAQYRESGDRSTQHPDDLEPGFARAPLKNDVEDWGAARLLAAQEIDGA
jgi:hypothetical protein